jgi:hypothetical protein
MYSRTPEGTRTPRLNTTAIEAFLLWTVTTSPFKQLYQGNKIKEEYVRKNVIRMTEMEYLHKILVEREYLEDTV